MSDWKRIEAERFPHFQRNKVLARRTLSEIHNEYLKGISTLSLEQIEPYTRYSFPTVITPIWREFYEKMYDRTAKDAANSTYAKLTGRKQTDFLNPINAYKGNLGGRIAIVNNTTSRKYLSVFGSALKITNDIGQIAQILNTSINGAYNRLRAAAIARSETVTAHNLGRREGAVATGRPIIKTWITMQDNDVRDAHAIANGQQKPLNQPFVVNNELLMFPGDFSLTASASNLVNCRCTEVYQFT